MEAGIGELVRVIWNDAQDHKDNWVAKEDAEAFTDEDCTIISYGIQVKKTSKYLTLAGDWDATDKDYGRVTKIPIGMVQSIEYLEIKKPTD